MLVTGAVPKKLVQLGIAKLKLAAAYLAACGKYQRVARSRFGHLARRKSCAGSMTAHGPMTAR